MKDNRKRKAPIFIGIAAMTLLVVAAPASCYFADFQKQMQFEEQLRQAKSEGIPTTPAEFIATLPRIKPEENAANEYLKLPRQSPKVIDSKSTLQKDLIDNPTPDRIAAAEKALQELKPWLDPIDRAVQYPHCLIEKDYSHGMCVVIFPEYTSLKYAAKAKCLRATLLAIQGKDKEAIHELDSLTVIRTHLFEQPNDLAPIVGYAIDGIAMNLLIKLSFKYPHRLAYREAIRAGTEDKSKPNKLYASNHRLFDAISTIKLCETKEGLAEFGITGDAAKPDSNFITAIQPKSEARINLVKAYRDLFREINGLNRHDKIDKIEFAIMQAMISFPNAAMIYEGLDMGLSPTVWFDNKPILRRNLLTAFLRATETFPYRTSIKTDDLISPSDGKPLAYKFDGKQMTFEWQEADGEPRSISFP